MQEQRGIGLLADNIFSVAYYNCSLLNRFSGVVSNEVVSENEVNGRWTSFEKINLGIKKLNWESVDLDN
jgi:hypothetical protein